MPTNDALDLAKLGAAAALLAKAAPVHLRLDPHHPAGVHLALGTILNALPDLLALAEEAERLREDARDIQREWETGSITSDGMAFYLNNLIRDAAATPPAVTTDSSPR